jgi:hypothetical protein
VEPVGLGRVARLLVLTRQTRRCRRQEARIDRGQVMRMKEQELESPSRLTKNVKLPPEVRRQHFAAHSLCYI